jgi:hypothetical protein
VVDEAGIRLRYQVLDPVLDERSRRRFAAAEAKAAGRGGVSAVSRIARIARSTIIRGLAELAVVVGDDPASKLQASRIRRPGGGRKKLTEIDPTLLSDLRGLIEPATRGDPEAALAAAEPAISVDTKKKELVGDFKNAGRELRPKGQPEPVRVHDVKIPELGRASPYGVYDIAGNTGWVSVGIDHDTASFAVNAIRRWWHAMGQTRYYASFSYQAASWNNPLINQSTRPCTLGGMSADSPPTSKESERCERSCKG